MDIFLYYKMLNFNARERLKPLLESTVKRLYKFYNVKKYYFSTSEFLLKLYNMEKRIEQTLHRNSKSIIFIRTQQFLCYTFLILDSSPERVKYVLQKEVFRIEQHIF